MQQQTVVERAFQLANEGECKFVSDISRVLVREGYDFAFQHVNSPTLYKQLKKMLAAHRMIAE